MDRRKRRKDRRSVAIVKFSEKEASFVGCSLIRGERPRTRTETRRRVFELCRKVEYSSVFLWTVNTLPVAAMLYKSAGFNQTEELTHVLWGSVVTEVRYELALK